MSLEKETTLAWSPSLPYAPLPSRRDVNSSCFSLCT